MISILFCARNSIYKTLKDSAGEPLDCWDKDRDAMKWPGGNAIVAHPPCRAMESLDAAVFNGGVRREMPESETMSDEELRLLIDKFPPFSLWWSPDIKDIWFRQFEALRQQIRKPNYWEYP